MAPARVTHPLVRKFSQTPTIRIKPRRQTPSRMHGMQSALQRRRHSQRDEFNLEDYRSDLSVEEKEQS